MTLPKFKNQKLFEEAFIHRSYLNEAKEKLNSNERLEFLGDSIVSLVVSEYLFQKYPHFNEGKLTNLRSLLVNTKNLAEVARILRFGSLLRLSKGEEESMGRENLSLLADCFEAYIGALYLDQGIEKVKAFLAVTLFKTVEAFVKKDTLKDPKSLLQEYIQARKQKSPVYRVLHEEGPAHAKTFTVGVFSDTKMVGVGNGKSKQEAEEKAAIQALQLFDKT